MELLQMPTVWWLLGAFAAGCIVAAAVGYNRRAVGGALRTAANWLSSMWSRLWRPSSVRPSFLRDQASLKAIERLAARAHSLKLFATFFFIASILSVAAGVILFIFAEDIVTRDAVLEDLRDRLGTLQGRKATLTAEDQELDRFVTLAVPVIKVEWDRLKREFTFVAQLVAQVESQNEQEQTEFITSELSAYDRRRDRVQRALHELGIKTAAPSDQQRSQLTNSQQNRFHRVLEEQNLSVSELNSLGSEYLTLMQNPFDGDDLRTTVLDDLKGLAEQIGPVRSNIASAYDALLELEADTRRRVGEATEGVGSVQQLEEEIADVQRAIANRQAEFDPSNINSMVPLLVVRVGAVILLIFLTQILLAAYRYNTMLSAHYDALADALCLAQRRQDERAGPDIVDMKELAEVLRPKDASYVPPPSPIESFRDLATNVAKGGKD